MKIAGVCFTKTGKTLSLRTIRALRKMFSDEELTLDWYGKGKYIGEGRDPEAEEMDLKDVRGSISDWARYCFRMYDALIFVGASGIAVRAIAPYVRDKRSDPAVIVIDEQGKFCISLLSGHIGGANALVASLSEEIGSIPVITTATDVSEKWAVDVFASGHDMAISNMTYAKEVSAAMLAGAPVGFNSSFKVQGDLPAGMYWADQLSDALAYHGEKADEGTTLGIDISPFYKNVLFDHTLWLIPKCLVIGIGCKKDTPYAKIERAVGEALKESCLYPEAIAAVASIDIKAEEPGILHFCREHEVEFTTYPAEELSALTGDFTPSEFVKDRTGVDNVCERSALLRAGKEGRLILKKTAQDGVTVAAALIDRTIRF